jgi:hypothetical protein
VRLVLLLAGAAISAAAFSLVGGLTPATRSNTAVQAAVAILVPALVVALTRLRRAAIPVLLGSIVATGALSAPAASVSDVLLTALLAAAATRAFGALGRARGRGAGPGTAVGQVEAATGSHRWVDASDDGAPESSTHRAPDASADAQPPREPDTSLAPAAPLGSGTP